MKRIKKITLFLLTLTIMLCASVSIAFAAGAIPEKIIRISKASQTVTAGSKFELRVTTEPWHAEDDFICWKIVSGDKVIRFDDYDRTGDEADFRALKSGTANICCYIYGKEASTKLSFTIKVEKANKKNANIQRIGKKNRRVEIGDDIELKVRKKGGVPNRKLVWSIGNKNILRFDEWRHTGHEMDFKAIGFGSTTVTCKIKGTGKKVTFKVRVVHYYDDDDDDD